MPKYLIELDTEVVYDVPGDTARDAVKSLRKHMRAFKKRVIIDVYMAVNRDAWREPDVNTKKIRKV